MAKYLAERAKLVGAGTVNGRLYDFGTFPGIVEANDDADRVVGEIWELHDADATLPELDRYEGCVPHEPQPWVFVRRLNEVLMANGNQVYAWVYWYSGDVADGRWIESGDYCPQ